MPPVVPQLLVNLYGIKYLQIFSYRHRTDRGFLFDKFLNLDYIIIDTLFMSPLYCFQDCVTAKNIFLYSAAVIFTSKQHVIFDF